MKHSIGKTSMVLSAALLLGASSTTSLYSAFAQDEAESVESVEVIEESAEVIGESVEESTTQETDHTMMEHDDEGRLPGNIKIEREPTYQVGDDATLLEGHMPGMEGATVTIIAAFDTVAYEISYDPTDGSERVENHRWIVHEEIADEGAEPYQVGDEVLVEAYHMPGMEGATAMIDAVSDTTVYLIDYIDTETGETVINHKWVTEEELSALEEAAESVEETETSSEESEVSSDESSSEESSSDESSESSSEEPGESSSETSSEESSSEESQSSDESESSSAED